MKRISLPALGMGIVSKTNKNRQVSVCAAHKKSRINNCLFYFFVFKLFLKSRFFIIYYILLFKFEIFL